MSVVAEDDGHAIVRGLPSGSRFDVAPTDFALLQANGFTITLSGQLLRAKPATGQLPVEIVLAVESVRDAYSRLRSKDITILNEPHTIDGTNDGAHFEDPDGHLFSLFGRP